MLPFRDIQNRIFLKISPGSLGFERPQHRRTPRPSVGKSHRKALRPFGSHEGPRGSSPPVQKARGERLKGGPHSQDLQVLQVVNAPTVGKHLAL